ncbi:MAG: ABC transporter ATP-binding protein [Kiritimatiellia bacterium]|nr:ABC transporter ATP-binding protein [Kiritimatiellia bacterium]
MKTHHRNYAFRPPYREKERKKGPLILFSRFIRTYVAPFRKLLLICALMALLDYCGSFYLLAYYSKVVIDSVLVVGLPAVDFPPQADLLWHETVKENSEEKSLLGLEREKEKHRPPKAAEKISRRAGTEIKERFSIRPPGARQKLWGIFLLYIITLMVGNFLTRSAGRLRIRIGQKLTLKLREDMHAQVMRLSLDYHALHTPGRLLARIISDTGAVQDQVMSIFVNGVSQLAIVLVGSVILLIINWQMMVIVALSLPFYVLIYKISNPVLIKIQREMSHTNACLWGLVSQKLDAIRMIQVCNRENRERLSFHRLAACYLRDSLVQNRVGAASNTLGASLSGLTSGVVIFLYGIYQVQNNNLSLGQMMYAWGTACALFGPILQISNLNTTFANLLVYLRRLSEVLDEPVKITDASDAVDLSVPLRRGIVLDHVRFGYDPDGEEILKDISLTVPSGAWLCIVGASGCGKTTLLHLIDRLFEPNSGMIRFDDTPLQKIRLSSLRRQMALVPQEAQIISGTVRENICYGWNEAEPAQIIAAAMAAEFHDFVMTLPAKYETMLGEKGTSLSGGQKQRLSLARALLTNPEVLLLDDCTSALDAKTEKKIQDTLSKIMAGKTAVIVSQRVSMAKRCQRICVIEAGLVVDSGTHAELIAREGFYARLYARQTE